METQNNAAPARLPAGLIVSLIFPIDPADTLNPMFARRTGWHLQENAITAALRSARAGGSVLDLTVSNPTDCGFHYDVQNIRSALSSECALHYQPVPFGLPAAREHVVRYYSDRQCSVAPEQIMLTASTSEAYSYIFRLLCDPGNEVLVPRPSYPLFDLLADVMDVQLTPYDLFYDHGWHFDFHTLQAHSPNARAVIVVNPNNPTGSYVFAEEQQHLRSFCAQQQMAIIADEVFWDYPLERAQPAPSFARPQDQALTFTLSGLSKVAALPQIKLAWTVVQGPDTLRRDALERLEVIADTFLSVSAPVQHAIPQLFGTTTDIQRQIRERTRANLTELDRQLASSQTMTRLRADAGWYAVLRIPRVLSDDDFAIRLLERERVLVHPGHFYNFTREGCIVLSLLPLVADFKQGVTKLISIADAVALK